MVALWNEKVDVYGLAVARGRRVLQLAVQHHSNGLVLRELRYRDFQRSSVRSIGPDAKRYAVCRVFVPKAAYLRQRSQTERDELAPARVYRGYWSIKVNPGAAVVEHILPYCR